jgi:hypothetical protein
MGDDRKLRMVQVLGVMRRTQRRRHTDLAKHLGISPDAGWKMTYVETTSSPDEQTLVTVSLERMV